ncbi:MAG TPA: hypothetical protein DCM62_09555 [Bacteroidales bacterium]|nr:hypothetical protein [Bacteroidales bacterium]
MGSGLQFATNLQSLRDLKKDVEMKETFLQITFEPNRAIFTDFVMPKASKVYRRDFVLQVRPRRGRRENFKIIYKLPLTLANQ